MEGTKLVLAFDQLSKSETKEFSNYVDSSSSWLKKELKKLLEYLIDCKFYLKLEASKEKAFKKIFPNSRKYNNQKLRTVMSELFKHIESFLVQKHLAENSINSKLILAEHYRNKNEAKLFDANVNQIFKKLDASPYRNAAYYSSNYKTQWERFHFAARRRRMGEENLQLISDTLDIYYLAEKLRLSCYLLTHKALLNVDYDLRMTELIHQYVSEQENLLEIPAINVYYYSFLTLVEPKQEKYFQSFKESIQKNADLFPEDEIRDLYLSAINYCIKKINSGKESYLREAFELFKISLEKEILLEDGVLSHFAFNNISAAGIKVKEFDWVEIFIERYEKKLPRKQRDVTVSMNKARLAYAQNKLEEAMTLLQGSDYKDLLNSLISKNLLMKIYYELGEYSLLQSHMESMKKFIYSKKFLGYQKQNYLRNIKWVKRLSEVNHLDKGEVRKFKEKLLLEESLVERNWCLEQVEKLLS